MGTRGPDIPVQSILVKRIALLLAGCLFLVPGVFAQGPADWAKDNTDPVGLAKKAEAMFKSFRTTKPGMGVVGKATLNGKAAAHSDPLGYGFIRDRHLNVFFWSPTKFQLSYVVYGQIPTAEYLWSDGAGKMMRVGPLVGTKNKMFSTNQHLFDVATDEELVEKWPTQFTKYLFSPFVSGNATLTRYVAALKKGVGGYSVTVEKRQNPREHRILASRPKTAKHPASSIEIIFMDTPNLPVLIHTTYGNVFDLVWRMGWYNGSPMPSSPSEIKD